jgi:hypothetical protein
MELISRSKIVSVGFLVAILLISLAISLFFPYIDIQHMEGFQEGLLGATEQTNIAARLQKYMTDTEAICSASISGANGSQGLNKITWVNQTEENNALPIIQNVNYTNTAKIDNLNNASPPFTTPAAETLLTNNTASRYAITVTMLKDLKNMNITDDSAFTDLLNKNIATPIPSGNNSSYNKINNYLSSIGRK